MSAKALQLRFRPESLPIAKPFIKWVGGKRRVIPELIKDMPSEFGGYYEPFIGGGALFFYLRSQGLLLDRDITISDLNLRLIRTYTAVRDDVENLIDRLADYSKRHGNTFYYNTRSMDIDKAKSDVDVAAWFVYLNKTAFNGLYRVNKKNQFNAPIGRYKNPAICDADNLRACSLALENVDIKHGYFDHMRHDANPGDFIYFDPPYVPVSVTSSFTSYTDKGFGSLEQRMLRDLAADFKESGVHVMLSNADTEYVRNLYDGFNIRSIQVGRAINCKAGSRGSVGEVIVT